MPVKVMIADDERPARERLRHFLASQPDAAIVAEAGDGAEAIRLLQSAAPDLLFLDVEMPALDGFEVLSALEPEEMPVVVFVTAYEHYAARAFEVEALDYLVKPFNQARFDAAWKRAVGRLRPGGEADRWSAEQIRLFLAERIGAPYLQRFVVRKGERIFFARPDDVRRIEADGNYVRLHSSGGEHLVRGTIREMESRLDPASFVRVHRSWIVNLNHVRQIEPYFHGEYVITLTDGARLHSSRGYSARLRELLRG